MIDVRHASDVMDVRSYRDADLVSDHFLVIMQYRQRITRFRDVKLSKQKKSKVNNLLNRQGRKVCQNKLKGRISNEYAEFNDEGIINSKWDTCKNILLKNSAKVLGKEYKKKNNEGFCEEC